MNNTKLCTLTLFIFFSLTIHAQQTSDDAIKSEDKRYIAKIDFFDTHLKLRNDSRLVGGMTLGIELWTLLGEPVENYIFKWEKSGVLYSKENDFLLQAKWLEKYPDLKKRYSLLEPTSIKLKYTVNFDFSGNEAQLQGIPYEMKLPTSKWIVQGNREINSITDFYITKSGKEGKELSPGSPKNWKEFIQYNYLANYSNEQAKSIFVRSKKAVFFSLELLELEVPELEINLIIKEYLKRENGGESVSKNNLDVSNDWGDFSEKKVSKRSIGESYKGGIIFYIDKTGEHGLIYSEESLRKMNWQSAIKFCKNYENAGYYDWYLPNTNEFEYLRNNIKVFNFSTNTWFWTSNSITGRNDAFARKLNSQGNNLIDKNNLCGVIAIRAF